MKKIAFTVLILFIISSYIFAASVAISEVPRSAITFADTYFADYYLFRATETGGSYALIFKGGLKIYVNGNGEWKTISGGGDEISIEYVETSVKNAIKKQFPNEKIIQIQKRKNDYKIQFKSRKNIIVDFEGNIKN